MATDCVLPQVALWGKGMVCALKRTSGLNGWISNQKHISLQSVALREGSRGFEGYHAFLGFRLAVRTPPTCLTFCYLGNGGVSFQPFHQALHIVLACDDCRMAVDGGKPAALVVVYPPF